MIRGRRLNWGVTLLHKCAVCVLIPVYECPHTILHTIFFFTHHYICGRRSRWCDAAAQLRYTSVLRPVYKCPHATIYICGRRGCGVTLLHSYEKASDNLDWIIGTHGARLSVGGLQLLVYEALSY